MLGDYKTFLVLKKANFQLTLLTFNSKTKKLKCVYSVL